MSRPNLGYSNYYWIRQDQKRLEKKLEAQRTSTARTDEPEEENITTPPVLPPETKAVQESEPDPLLPAPISSGFPTWTKTVQNP